jgi:hypothetical protein
LKERERSLAAFSFDDYPKCIRESGESAALDRDADAEFL